MSNDFLSLINSLLGVNRKCHRYHIEVIKIKLNLYDKIHKHIPVMQYSN